MFLQALHQYAQRKKLLTGLPFQMRTLHLLVPLTLAGEVRGQGFIALSTPTQKGKKTKEEPGRSYLLPRFPGENNGGKAYFLAESCYTVFGLRKDKPEPVPVQSSGRGDRNPVLAFGHFWQRILEAYERTKDERLRALLNFRDRYLPNRDGFVRRFASIEWRPNESAKKAEPEWHARLDSGAWLPLSKANTVGFEVGGAPLVVPAEADPQADPIWRDWTETFRHEAYADLGDSDETANERRRSTLCLVTGEVGEPVARSHKPKILGVPGLASGGYVVSFAKEAPAFSSYGFEMGENAPVSEQAAASYALALNDLLASEDTSFRVGDVAFCFWVSGQTQPSVLKFKIVPTAHPRAVADFLKSPFAGIDRGLARKEDFLSVALSANAGRVVIREWLRVSLEQAIVNLSRWFEDLAIVSLGDRAADDAGDEEKGGPCSLFRLAAAVVRDSKELKRVSEAVTGLYRAALTRQPPPIQLLEPLLAEFRSALVTDNSKKPRFPFNHSRFALLKLILIRNAKGDFMPVPQLAETDDASYNLGRLFCILDNLQDKAHDYELEGAGIVERYYGAASAAPASVFAVLWRLHNHHLRKVEQQGEKGQRDARAIRARIAEIVGKFPPSGPGQPPRFPPQLSLEEQGRFALGFYQQMAANLQAAREARKKAGENKQPESVPESV